MNNSRLNDEALVQQFIEGQTHLAANGRLQIRPALDTRQLIARNGQILAIARPQKTPPAVFIRPKSTYTPLLDRLLRSSAFFPVTSDAPQGFLCYQHHTVPKGYQSQCGPARVLWRQWWLRHRQGRPPLAELELLLFIKKNWRPIRKIIFNHSTLFITTQCGETAHQGEDLVVWAEAAAPASRGAIQNRAAVSRRAVREAVETPTPSEAAFAVAPPPLPTHLRQIVRQEAGRLYVETPLGELVVEGVDLRCHLKTL